MVGAHPPPALTMIQKGPLYLVDPARPRRGAMGAITARPAIPATWRKRRRFMTSAPSRPSSFVEELVVRQEVRHDRHPRPQREVLVVRDLRGVGQVAAVERVK